MNIGEFIKAIASEGSATGTFPLPQLLAYCISGSRSGVGISNDSKGQELFLLFVAGEPRGAVLQDDAGVLCGDTAVLRLRGTETFSFYPADPARVEQYAVGCQVYNKSHLRGNPMEVIPHLSRREAAGIDILTITVLSAGIPQAGLHVSIRKSGQVVGTDITAPSGKASFRLLFGQYECVIAGRDQILRQYGLRFSQPSTSLVVDLADPPVYRQDT